MDTMTIAIGLAALGAALGNAIIMGNLLSGMSRQPKLEGPLFSKALIGLAFVEGIFFVSIVLMIILKG